MVSGTDHIAYRPTWRTFTGPNAREQAIAYVSSGDLARDEAHVAMTALVQLRAPEPLLCGWEAHIEYCVKKYKIHKYVYYSLNRIVSSQTSDASVDNKLSYVLRFDTVREAAEMDKARVHPEASADSDEHNATLRDMRQSMGKLIASAGDCWSQLRDKTLQQS